MPAKTYSRYGLQIRRISGTKLNGTQWQGTLTMTTPADVQDYPDLQRDLEVLVIGNELPLFGYNPKLTGVAFNFAPSLDEFAEFGAVKCVITLNYETIITRLEGVEITQRLERLHSEVYTDPVQSASLDEFY